MVNQLSKENIIQNLKDIGCSSKQIADLMNYYTSGDIKQLIQVLKCQRCYLLDALHDAQKKIDCLDYLIYQLKKGEVNNGK